MKAHRRLHEREAAERATGNLPGVRGLITKIEVGLPYVRAEAIHEATGYEQESRMKAHKIAVTPPGVDETAADIPDDVRAELDREARLSGSCPPQEESASEVPDDVRAEHAAAQRALLEVPGNDGARLAPVESDTAC